MKEIPLADYLEMSLRPKGMNYYALWGDSELILYDKKGFLYHFRFDAGGKIIVAQKGNVLQMRFDCFEAKSSEDHDISLQLASTIAQAVLPLAQVVIQSSGKPRLMMKEDKYKFSRSFVPLSGQIGPGKNLKCLYHHPYRQRKLLIR